MTEGLIPEPKTAREFAGLRGISVAAAEYQLDALVKQGWAFKDDGDRYWITGLGLVVGERMGVVKPGKEWIGKA